MILSCEKRVLNALCKENRDSEENIVGNSCAYTNRCNAKRNTAATRLSRDKVIALQSPEWNRSSTIGISYLWADRKCTQVILNFCNWLRSRICWTTCAHEKWIFLYTFYLIEAFGSDKGIVLIKIILKLASIWSSLRRRCVQDESRDCWRVSLCVLAITLSYKGNVGTRLFEILKSMAR